jgi:hypothetical protein
MNLHAIATHPITKRIALFALRAIVAYFVPWIVFGGGDE